LRAAASSGALYPTDIYLVARDVTNLGAGAYYYDGPAHEIVRIRDEPAFEDVRLSLMKEPGLAEARFFVVLGTTFARTASKYTVRAYRYLALDAGHVALNLLTASRALGIWCTPSPAFDDQLLSAALGLSPSEEAPLLVFACGGAARRIPAMTPFHQAVPFPPNADEIELTRLSSAVTSMKLGTGFEWVVAPSAPRPAGNVPLPVPSPAAMDLFEVIRSRRSFREFDERAVSRAALAGLLADAASLLGWLRGATLVEPFVVVSRVADLEAGSYRYDAERHALHGPLVRGTLGVEQAGLDQVLLGRAAFVLSFALIDERAGTTEGPRDFRYAGLEAGLAGEAAYLSATARGLGISGVGAFYDDEAGALFTDDGRAPRILYLMGVGHRPRDSEP
jgi:SagB-type dehydrogenase family enzyme